MKNKLKLAIACALGVVVMSVATFAYNFNSNQYLIQQTNLENEIKLDKETESKEVTRTTKIVTEDKAYSDYAPYGLTYEEDENKLFYNGKSVRYFADVESTKHDKAAVFLSFGEVGDIDVFSVRDDDNNLTGLRVATKEEFDENTKGFENNTNSPFVYIRENVFKEKYELEKETEDSIANIKLGGITLNSKTKQNSNTSSAGATGSTGEFKSSITQYEQYGFAYQQNEKKYFYNGKSVRCFIDIIDASNGSATVIYEGTGDIDVFGVRDDNNNLTGLRVATKEEYDNLTKEVKNNGGSIWNYVRNISSKDKKNLVKEDENNLQKEDNRYEHYKDYGIFEYNKDNKIWYFNGEAMSMFLDMDVNGKEDGATSVSTYPNANGILVKVNRDSSGKIKDITTMSKEEAYKFITSNTSKCGGLEWIFK